MLLSCLAGPNHVLVSDPAMITIILGLDKNFVKSRFYDTFSPLYKGKPFDTVFSTRDSARNKALKLPLVKNMTGPVYLFKPTINDCVGVFIQAMNDMKEQPVDFKSWAQYWSFDVTSQMIFGCPYGFMRKRGDIDGLLSRMNLGLRYAAIIGQVPELHPWLVGNNTVMSFLSRFHSFPNPTAKILREAERRLEMHDHKPHTCGNTVLCRLARVQGTTDGRSRKLDDVNLLFETFVAAGTRVSATLGTVFYFLMENRATYEKLVHEVRHDEKSRIFDSAVKTDASLKMPYLDAVIKEAMRLIPTNSAPLERCIPRGGIDMHGYQIPEGTIISMSSYVIHRNSEVYGADVDSFCPERWMESDLATKERMEKCYLAFGKGARRCTGQELAMLEMRIFIIQVLRRFDVEWASQKPQWKLKVYWLVEHHNLSLKFKAR
ncbi:MAG: hypothetical protein Q9187_002163 [Circinaria calcarea]